jgi:hypothetical protein
VVRENEHEFVAGGTKQSQACNSTSEAEIEAEMITGL